MYVCMTEFCYLTTLQRLGLPVGQHLMVAAKIEDKLVIRAYTPISRHVITYLFTLISQSIGSYFISATMIWVTSTW